MKAAVMYQQGGLPQYTDFPEPIAQNDDELLVTVKAVAIKHLDKSRASGKHYSSDEKATSGRVIGGDGICVLADGTRVYGMGISGMLAEKATIHKDRIVKIPEGLDDVSAAALPNAVIGAAMGLKFKADIQPGDVVLINGATGFTGRVAVQIAKHYGAKKVIVTGRNQQSLNDLLSLGADETVGLLQDDESFKAQLTGIHSLTPIDVIIDYLWGHTAEMILACIKGKGSFTNKIRYVSVGNMAGDLIQLSAANLRSIDLQLTGSGLGAWSKAQVGQLFSEILPEMFQLAATGKLKVDTIKVKLEGIAELWNLDVPNGERLVVTIKPHLNPPR
ncbi:NADPH:quinone reductase-like Zn-dependent oxidoreductase [Mucilaginibacter frigoritolerans]|uniref:NADPH:quinone reductase-like Zn-dependent oxidoreductase n=1 Tax=Mucilaginibacter frigoritolerans TaxID=652788 RepID=A0A562U718_9SPHI|nr:zinc-binding alcohol dehydrogenase family protein [Mucilaginibacter frigoritolerans]TWJ01623.1 NADPH:quinone reductase-like Zn-dependent oxidoreductase [Mucilaginibacter frigoritolerans]